MTLPQITWSYVFEMRRDADGLLASDIEKATSALGHLRSIFGEDVMGLPVQFLERMLNRALWTYQWLIWFSESIHRVEPMGGYASLRERLINPTKFDEATSVLQVAERLVAAGLQVSFDMPVHIGGASKVPDILVQDLESDTKFFCEVSVLYSAKGRVDQSRVIDQIAKVLLFQQDDRVVFSGRLLRPLDEEEVDGLINRIQWEVWETRKEVSFREVALDGALLLALAPEEHKAKVASWAGERGLELNAFGGVSPGVNNAARLRYKIEEEVKQVPAGQPNLLVIPAQDLFVDADGPLALVGPAVESISHHERVAALILTSENFGTAIPLSTKMGEHVLLATSNRDGLNHQYLLLTNPNCSVTMAPSAMQKIRIAFSL